MGTLDRIRAYAEVMRLANVFTAISNVWMGMIFVSGGLPGWTAVGITATSALLYLAGMVLNDVFDYKLDAYERPERPIPSGRVSLGAARLLGWGLLEGGIACGWITAYMTSARSVGTITVFLAIAIFLYDSGGKRFAGPMLMGLCRMLNVGLGMSVVGDLFEVRGSEPIVIGIGLYIASVTLFARNENETVGRAQLVWCAAWTILSLALIAATPAIVPDGFELLQIQYLGWIILWIVIAGSILRRMVVAIMQPTPKFVQKAVGHAILSIIVIDAAICLGFAGPFWALAVLALLAPATLMAQFLKVT